MDRREAMALTGGSHPYYIHRGGVGGSGSLSQAGALHTPPGFRTLSNPSIGSHSNARPSSSGSAFSLEPSSGANYGHGVNTAILSGVPVSEPGKKKRGRPRKYAPDGQVSLGLSSLPVKPKSLSVQDPLSPKRARGRPPGTGRKQRLANLGEWMTSSAGFAFAPHVIRIGVGEDIVSKILSFSQQRPRAVCILSGTGAVSSVTLCQPASTEPTVTYEGRFEILCLSGSYLVAEEGGPRTRTGGVSASLSSHDGHVIGGAIGTLIAASSVQVVVCSFVHGDCKNKDKPVGRPKKEPRSQPIDKPATSKSISPASAPPTQGYTPSSMNTWPGSRQTDLRNSHTDIDLTRG